MVVLPLGSAVLVRYAGFSLWHERVPLARVSADAYVIITPDLDMYVETLAIPPLAGLRQLGPRRGLPPSISSSEVHRFRLEGRPGGFFTAEELERLKEEARGVAESDAGYDERVMALDGAPAMATRQSDASGLGPGESLVLREATQGEPKGTPVAGPSEEEESTRLGNVLLLRREGSVIVCDVVKSGASGVGASALDRLRERLGGGRPSEEAATPAADAGADVRTLPVRFDAAGRRFRDYADCMALVHEVELEDWPLDGPRTFREYADLIRRRGGTPSGYHTKWSSESQLDKKSSEALIHEIGMDVIELSFTVDQVNAPNLAAFELLGRWMQMLEHAVAQNSRKPELNNTGHFLGTQSRSGVGGLTSTLAKHVANRAAEEASVLKEQRKAREERALLRK